MTQLFTSCGELRTVSASSFDNSKIKKYASVLYGCSRLVGGTDGFVPSQTSGASVLKLGTGGVLTDPEYDVRTWLNATLFADGELEIGFSKAIRRVARFWPPTRCAPTPSTPRSRRRLGRRSARA